MTDYPDPYILASLEANAEALRERYSTSIQVAGLAWGDEAQETRLGKEAGPFDMVVAADVLWVSSQHENLLHSICALLARTPTARLLLVAGFHTGRPATARFFAAAKEAGLVPDPHTRHGGMYERSIFGDEKAWDPTESDMGDISERSRWVVVACLGWATSVLSSSLAS